MICSDHCISCGWDGRSDERSGGVKKFKCFVDGCEKDGYLSIGNNRHICADHYYDAQKKTGKHRATDAMVDSKKKNVPRETTTDEEKS